MRKKRVVAKCGLGKIAQKSQPDAPSKMRPNARDCAEIRALATHLRPKNRSRIRPKNAPFSKKWEKNMARCVCVRAPPRTKNWVHTMSEAKVMAKKRFWARIVLGLPPPRKWTSLRVWCGDHYINLILGRFAIYRGGWFRDSAQNAIARFPCPLPRKSEK
jgi:hypothetical protein